MPAMAVQCGELLSTCSRNAKFVPIVRNSALVIAGRASQIGLIKQSRALR